MTFSAAKERATETCQQKPSSIFVRVVYQVIPTRNINDVVKKFAVLRYNIHRKCFEEIYRAWYVIWNGKELSTHTSVILILCSE